MPTRRDDPPRNGPQIAPAPSPAPAPGPAASPGDPPAPQSADDYPLTEESFRAILSSHHRAGRWEVADEIEVRAIFGEVTLDFTRAELPPSGTIEIDALAVCGEIKIIVPDGAEVELDGTPVLGSIEQTLRKSGARERIREVITGERDEDPAAPPPPPELPYFHIDGRAILGRIKVTGR